MFVKPKTLRIGVVGLAIVVLGWTPAAFAAPTTFFGEDFGLGDFIPLSVFPNATAAQNSFLSNLTGVGTESFEGHADGTATPLAINFPGAVTATLNGGGNVEVVLSGFSDSGRYATDGTHFWETGSSNLTVNFNAPVAAFGFFGIDIGDFNGQVTLTTAGGLNQLFTIPNTTNGPSGSVLFFGVIDPTNTFTSVSFGNSGSGDDVFGFDQLTVGSLEQVKPVPEPGTGLLLLAGLSALVAWRWSKQTA